MQLFLPTFGAAVGPRRLRDQLTRVVSKTEADWRPESRQPVGRETTL